MHNGRDLLLSGAALALLTVVFSVAFADVLRPPVQLSAAPMSIFELALARTPAPVSR